MRRDHPRPRRVRSPDRRCRNRAGLALVEAAISSLIVGTMMVAALMTVGAARRSQYLTMTRGQGRLLAQAMMNEILDRDYEDPVVKDGFGREGGESALIRADWDDVDDYADWSASPPQTEDGQALPGLEGWTRSVSVVWVDPFSLESVSWSTGVKRITVTVKRGEQVLASMVAIRTDGWPVDEDRLQVLLVVTNAGGLTSGESVRKALMESWEFAVTPVSASESQAVFDAAVADADVAYVSTEIGDADLGAKLRNAGIGVVNEHHGLVDEFGFSAESATPSGTGIDLVDNSHYITTGLPLGALTLLASEDSLLAGTGPLAPNLHNLATISEVPEVRLCLLTLQPGDVLAGSTDQAAGRRVLLPWGGEGFNINSLAAGGAGVTIMKRAIEWAANKEQPS